MNRENPTSDMEWMRSKQAKNNNKEKLRKGA